MNIPEEPTAAQQAESRLTAWVLHELPAPDASSLTAEFAADPALKSEVEATGVFCALLESELRIPGSDSSLLQLPAVARQSLEAAARQQTQSRRRSVSFWMPSLAAAACVGIMFVVFTRTKGTLTMDARGEWVTAPQAASPDPVLAPSAVPEGAEAERLLMRTGLGYYDLGRFAEAQDQFNKVLALNPGHTAARRQLERTEKEVNNYYRAARDHTRIGMINDLGSLERVTDPAAATNPDEAARGLALALVPASPTGPAPAPPPGQEANHRFYYQSKDLMERRATRGRVRPGTAESEVLSEVTLVPALRESLADAISPSYQSLPENPFLPVLEQPLSTFSIDVDTASYAIARRYLNEGQRPPAEAVRLEEMINYFPMDAEPPAGDKPFAVQVETASAPWKAGHRLVRVALKGKVPVTESRGPANLVFLVDTSGSMAQPNKLPLVQQSLQLLLAQLEPRDHVTLVTYAGESELKLPATPVSQRATVAAAIDALSSGGSTNGSGGITAAYQQARSHFVPGGVNRVILATDGDFNVGLTSQDDLQALITREAKSGVYLSVLAYGSDNLKDTTAELLADKGNGNYAYIDSLSEARRALVTQLQGTLVTIAKDVKIQVEFNPAQVSRYRLLGYENRALANQDFNDDTKDAGEIGAGHSVTALYEIVPAGQANPAVTTTDPLKYQTTPAAVAPPPASLTPQAASGELLTVKLRYQQPEGSAPSQLLEVPVKDPGTPWDKASANFRWTAAVAGYALLLRESTHAGDLSWDTVRTLASGSKGPDPDGLRGEFLQLIDKAAGLVPGK